MRRPTTSVLIVAAGLVTAFVLGTWRRAWPLGVPGEWEWLRVPTGPTPIDLALAGLAAAGYACFAAAGARSLANRPRKGREGFWLLCLAFASVAVQAAVQSGAPVGYGLEKWVVALSQKGSNGYYNVAKSEVGDLRRFLADYPSWIKKQDALHIGTHPPGLVAGQHLLLKALGDSPAAARFVVEHAPGPVTQAFRYFDTRDPMPAADRATLVLTGLLTLLACGLTVVPLYLLARSTLPPGGAWGAAVLWPVVPAAVLFQPTADTAFPALSASALALTAWSMNRPTAGGLGLLLASASGLLLGVGMQLTLAFLAVGFIVGLSVVLARDVSARDKLALLLATGAGFLGLTGLFWLATGADPFTIWWSNQANHARFYVEYPRSYWPWLAENLVELPAALGLPAAVWGLACCLRPRETPAVSPAALATLALLTLSGRSLSEVGRLWLPFMPALLVASGAAIDRLGAGPRGVGITVALTASQTLALQSMIQVVYPV